MNQKYEKHDVIVTEAGYAEITKNALTKMVTLLIVNNNENIVGGYTQHGTVSRARRIALSTLENLGEQNG
jgi:hypothetical protein